jgi:hypothetical protein
MSTPINAIDHHVDIQRRQFSAQPRHELTAKLGELAPEIRRTRVPPVSEIRVQAPLVRSAGIQMRLMSGREVVGPVMHALNS